MSLLREIQDGVAGDTVSLSALLRKVKLLANRIGVREIGEWAGHELSGYDSIAELPPYRGPFEATVLGNAFGPFGSALKRFPIPMLALSEEYRNDPLFKLYFLHGVAELESLAAAKQTLHAPWPSDTVAAFPIITKGGTFKIDPEMIFVEIWKEIPYSTLIGVLDAVRTRLLDLSMQLGEEEPSVEHEQRITNPERVERATNTFNTIVYAGAANVALGNRGVAQIQKQLAMREAPLSSIPSLVQNNASDPNDPNATVIRNFDVFISHASEDKDAVVRPLAAALRKGGLKVWYDEFEIKIGDSLRREIDAGLANSRFGVIVLSRSFLKKAWTNYELDGLVTRAVTEEQVLLPIWHELTKQELIDYSPSLTDKVARSTATHTIEEIAQEIIEVVRPT